MDNNVSPLRGHVMHQRRLAEKARIDGLSSEIDTITTKLEALIQERHQLEQKYYTPVELAQINLLRRANKQNW